MFSRLFWIIVGAGVGLWGRQRTIRVVETNVPEPVRRIVRRTVVRFVEDVRTAEAKSRSKSAINTTATERTATDSELRSGRHFN